MFAIKMKMDNLTPAVVLNIEENIVVLLNIIT